MSAADHRPKPRFAPYRSLQNQQCRCYFTGPFYHHRPVLDHQACGCSCFSPAPCYHPNDDRPSARRPIQSPCCLPSQRWHFAGPTSCRSFAHAGGRRADSHRESGIATIGRERPPGGLLVALASGSIDSTLPLREESKDKAATFRDPRRAGCGRELVRRTSVTCSSSQSPGRKASFSKSAGSGKGLV
jgi:hypothetical protein